MSPGPKTRKAAVKSRFPSLGAPVGLTGLLLLLSFGALDPVRTAPPAVRVPGAEAVEVEAPARLRDVIAIPERTVAAPATPGPAPLPVVPVRIRSDFAGALNGWETDHSGDVRQLEHRLERGADGRKGFLRFRDVDGGASDTLVMPSVHVGPLLPLYGGEVRFASRLTHSAEQTVEAMTILRLIGADGTSMTYRNLPPPRRHAWTYASIPVRPGAWEIEGRTATEAEMTRILSEVARAELRIERLRGSGAAFDLDDFEFISRHELESRQF